MSSDEPKERPGFKRHFENHLKPHAITAIENTIAEAITQLTGYGYDCRILKIDFTEGTQSNGGHLDLKLFRNSRKDDDSMKSDYEREQEKKDELL